MNLLISKNITENMRKNQAINKSESTDNNAINLTNLDKPEINSVENEKIQGKIAATKIAMYFLKLGNSLQYIEIENHYTKKM